MILMRKNRMMGKAVDMSVCTLRIMVERGCNKLKNSCRLASGSSKTAGSFLGFTDTG